MRILRRKKCQELSHVVYRVALSASGPSYAYLPADVEHYSIVMGPVLDIVTKQLRA